MKCRHCNAALAPLRNLADGEFCCDEHRRAFRQSQDSAFETMPEAAALEATLTPEPAISSALQMLRRKFGSRPAPQAQSIEAPVLAANLDHHADESQFTAAEEQVATEYFEDAADAPNTTGFDLARPWREAAASWHWICKAWNSAPRDLKLVTVGLPLLAAIAVTGMFPKVPIKTVAPTNVAQVEKAVNDQWKNLTQTISNRAAISYADDFRSGLDAWESRSNLTTSWSYDAAGFVRPGPLALFKPSHDLTDYRFEFLGEIDQKALGWVFRAEDLKNYYAVKLVVVKPGPLPLVDLVHYAVINGKAGPEIRRPLPITVRADMLYRILMDVRGDDFTLMVQGQLVDFWTDHRLEHGGVGFFSARGERARLRWMEVSHQYDALGRVCAYLAPYGIEGRNGSFN